MSLRTPPILFCRQGRHFYYLSLSRKRKARSETIRPPKDTIKASIPMKTVMISYFSRGFRHKTMITQAKRKSKYFVYKFLFFCIAFLYYMCYIEYREAPLHCGCSRIGLMSLQTPPILFCRQGRHFVTCPYSRAKEIKQKICIFVEFSFRTLHKRKMGSTCETDPSSKKL